MSLILRTLRYASLPALLAVPPFVLVAYHASAAAPAEVQTVSIRNFAFVPQIITVTAGTTVRWTNADEDPHTVTANDKSFHSPALDSEGTFSFTFTKPGDYAYFCALHPHMIGKVIVKG
jgi:plastocyanin